MNYIEAVKHYNRIVKLIGSKRCVKIVFDDNDHFLEINDKSERDLHSLCKDLFYILLNPNDDMSERAIMRLKGAYEVYKSMQSAILFNPTIEYVEKPFIIGPTLRIRQDL